MRLGLLVAVVVLTSAVAAQAGVSRVVIIALPLDEAAGGQALSAQINTQALLAHDDRLEIVDPAGRYAPEDAVEIEKQVAAGKAAVQDVTTLLARVEYEGARGRAEEALATLRTSDFRATRDLYLQLLMQLSRIKQALRADDAGAAELAQAFTIDPDAAPLRGLNSEERKAFDAAKTAAAAAPKAAAAVITSETGGWLWIDGRFRGVTPAKLSDLPAGRHFITFAAPGSRASSQTELFGSLTTLKVAAPLTQEGRTFRSLLAALESSMKKQQPAGAARELLAWVGADEVIAVGLSTQGPSFVVRVGSSGLARIDLKEGSNASLAAAIRALVEEQLRPDLVPAIAPQAPVEVRASSGSAKTTGWVLVGVGAAAVVAGVAMVIAGQGQYQAAQKVPQVDSELYASTVSAGRALNYGGTAALAAGVVAAGVGVYLVW